MRDWLPDSLMRYNFRVGFGERFRACSTDIQNRTNNYSALSRWDHPQQGDLRLSGPPSGQGAGGRARTRDRWIPADLRADSLPTAPPTPLTFGS
ncbi:hypothetical protein PoB_007485200 [Plakobranchus ocellatus]|uniref:Uncharacterized protein n=1 Tax=Plakobranchus ocellatus TaxID=259542 RepID=A0AAV4DVM7_9GAST|nr:hypothetical protein PoB_007485200 [Plakobranchus ocellatus]